MEKVIEFNNNNKLFGIVHIPETSNPNNKRIGINLVNPGIKNRVAPNRLNVKIARKLCEMGYFVLRFDPHGIGDSEGNLPNKSLIADIWEDVQTGLFVDDTIKSNDFFIKEFEIEDLILMGGCGGAMTSLLTSARDDRVGALCLIDVPVNLRESKMSFVDKVNPEGERSDWYFTEYLKNILRPKSVLRFLTFKTDYRALFKVFKNKLKKLFSKNTKNTIKQINEDFCSKNNLNSCFYSSYENFVKRNKPILFLLAGNDPGTEIFKKYFESIFLLPTKYDSNLIQKQYVENANHIYTLKDWQDQLIKHIEEWMHRYVEKQFVNQL